MKIEYLQAGADVCPLVRLYDFDAAAARHLRQIFNALADGLVEQIRLDSVESVDGTQIIFTRSTRDSGVVEAGSRRFEVLLAPEGWRMAADLTEPFCDGRLGYQWLTSVGDIQLLLSKMGDW